MPASFIGSQRVVRTMSPYASTVVVIAGLAATAFAAPPAESAGGVDAAPAALIDPEVFRPVLVPEGSLISRGIRAGESGAYYRVLDHARRVDPETLRRAAARFLASRQKASGSAAVRRLPAEEFPVFVDLYENVRRPEVYLGKPVTLRGHLRKLVEMPAGENPHGIRTLYEAWLFTSDSQQHPTVLVMTSVPPGLLEEVRRLKAANRPVLVNGVSGSGYFFKMYGYPAADAYRFAPLVLGGRLEWVPPRPGDLDRSLPVVLATGVVVFGLPIGWFVWKNRSEDRRRRKHRAAGTPESFSWESDAEETRVVEDQEPGGVVEET
jgi:hypothetical protein